MKCSHDGDIIVVESAFADYTTFNGGMRYEKTTILCIALLLIMLCLTACQNENEYTPTGEFYIKTSASRGDTGVVDVISLEADSKTYEGDGDIAVPMTVGLGHLPGVDDYGDDVRDTFCVQYQIIEAPLAADKAPVWEKKVEYTDSWDDSKYDSTEQKNRPFLIFPHYGEFYPLYKETVEFVFPEDVTKGYVQIIIFTVIEGQANSRFCDLEFYFERVGGVLTLDPRSD